MQGLVFLLRLGLWGLGLEGSLGSLAPAGSPRAGQRDLPVAAERGSEVAHSVTALHG